MIVQTTILSIVAFACIVALGAVSMLFWEVYKAADELVEAVENIMREVEDMDSCSKKDVEEAVERVRERTGSTSR